MNSKEKKKLRRDYLKYRKFNELMREQDRNGQLKYTQRQAFELAGFKNGDVEF